MLVGVPREIKDSEYRVGLVPSTVRELTSRNHRVLVQKDAGLGAGIPDDAYVAAGAEIAPGPDRIFADTELIVKVKEPLAAERKKLRPGQVLFTYLHLAADAALTRALMASGATCIAYETVEDQRGRLPLLAPHRLLVPRLAMPKPAMRRAATRRMPLRRRRRAARSNAARGAWLAHRRVGCFSLPVLRKSPALLVLTA